MKKFLLLCITALIVITASAQEPFILKGRVTSFEENPLFNVIISVKKSRYVWHSTSSDSLGNFTLPEVYSGDTLMLEGVQFGSHKELIKRNNYMLIRVPLKREQISGAGIEAIVRKRDLPKIKVSKKEVEDFPVQGIFSHNDVYPATPVMKRGEPWRKFNEEVNKQIIYPREAIANHIEGIIVVGFNIAISGDLINPRILKGIGFGCDEEVIRVLSLQKNNWRPAMQNGYPIEQEFEYTVSFSLKEE